METMHQEPTRMHSQQTRHNGQTEMVMVGAITPVETMQMRSQMNTHSNKTRMEMAMVTIPMESTQTNVQTAHQERL